MRDLALDPTTGDLLIEAGRCRLTQPGSEAVRQKLLLRLGLLQGEYAPDRSVGQRWVWWFERKGEPRALFEAEVRQTITTCPGIASLDSFSLAADATSRVASLSFEVTTTDGDTVTVEDWRPEVTS